MNGKISLELGIKFIVRRAQVLPFLRDNLRLRSLDTGIRSFSKDDGETGFEMPVDMTMQEPGPWVISDY